MSQECAQEVLTALDRKGGASCAVCQSVKIGGRIIGEAMMFEVGPDVLDGIELWGVGRQIGQVCRTRQEALLDRLVLVRLEAVPDRGRWVCATAAAVVRETGVRIRC